MKTRTARVTIEALAAAAEDMNKTLALEPQINVAETDVGALSAAILAEATAKGPKGEDLGVQPTDALQPTTWTTLAALGVTVKPGPAVPKAKGKAPAPVAKTPATPKAPPAPKVPKAPPAPKEPRFTRADALAVALATGETDEDKLVTLSDAEFVKATGKGSNPKEAQWALRVTKAALLAMGWAKETETGLVLKYKVAR